MDRWFRVVVNIIILFLILTLEVDIVHSKGTCDVNIRCSCCEDATGCGSGNEYWCKTTCKDGFWGGRCIQPCPAECISCDQYYRRKQYLCFQCVSGKYGRNCSENCPGQCLNGICKKSSGDCLICNPGYYDLNCSKRCPANCNHNCSMHSGHCDSCIRGHYGYTCERLCPPHCATNICVQGTGHCVNGCQVNFKGDKCELCMPGKYGEDCSKNCSEGCKDDICGNEHGECTFGCKNGYSGSRFCCANNRFCVLCETLGKCTECVNGTYGKTCERSCPKHCNGTCDVSSGKCYRCFGGHYGDYCSIICNKQCKHNVCDIANGQCVHGCTNNSTARDCGLSEEMTDIDVPVTAVAATVASVSVAVIFIILSFLLYHRRCKKRNTDTGSEAMSMGNTKSETSTEHLYFNTNLGSPVDDYDDDEAENENHVGPSEDIPTACPYYNDKRIDRSSTFVRIDKLQELITKSDERYRNEFSMLPEGLIKPYIEACKPQNLTRNRYNAIYPYDANRVKVVYGHADYINASYIEGYDRPQAYIAALGPTKKTIGNFDIFWKMVWQKKVEAILMLTRLVESSGMKCDQYWPDKGTVMKCAGISITCLSEEIYAEFTTRQFIMTFMREQRQLHHVQFTAWPDKGVPDDIISIINLRQRVIRIRRKLDGPLLVHCSAGVGRTGTYIALDILTRQGAAENAVDVFNCVLNLRQQRVKMVQVLEQYQFLHRAVVWSLLVDIRQFLTSSFRDLTWIEQTLTDMFEMLQSKFPRSDSDTNDVPRSISNSSANRETSDTPDRRYTVHLWNEGQCEAHGYGYTNAVYINGFRRKDRFIAAQTPLPDTVLNFLNMIIQCDVCCIIDLEPLTENQSDIGEYLPPENQNLHNDSFIFRVTNREYHNCYTKRKIEVLTESESDSVYRNIEHFTYTQWPRNASVPNDAVDFVQLLHDVDISLSSTKWAGPILVHCQNGGFRSGLLCGIWLSIERLEHEQRVSVINTLRQVKYRRRNAIVSKEQLKFCFECVSVYVNQFEKHVYSN